MSRLAKLAFAFGCATLAAVTVHAQGRNSPPPPPLPQTFFSGDTPIRVVPVVRGLAHPWSLAFLPDGSMLVTEREGRLRIIRDLGNAGVPAGVDSFRAAKEVFAQLDKK